MSDIFAGVIYSLASVGCGAIIIGFLEGIIGRGLLGSRLLKLEEWKKACVISEPKWNQANQDLERRIRALESKAGIGHGNDFMTCSAPNNIIYPISKLCAEDRQLLTDIRRDVTEIWAHTKPGGMLYKPSPKRKKVA